MARLKLYRPIELNVNTTFEDMNHKGNVITYKNLNIKVECFVNMHPNHNC